MGVYVSLYTIIIQSTVYKIIGVYVRVCVSVCERVGLRLDGWVEKLLTVKKAPIWCYLVLWGNSLQMLLSVSVGGAGPPLVNARTQVSHWSVYRHKTVTGQ